MRRTMWSFISCFMQEKPREWIDQPPRRALSLSSPVRVVFLALPQRVRWFSPHRGSCYKSLLQRWVRSSTGQWFVRLLVCFSLASLSKSTALWLRQAPSATQGYIQYKQGSCLFPLTLLFGSSVISRCAHTLISVHALTNPNHLNEHDELVTPSICLLQQGRLTDLTVEGCRQALSLMFVHNHSPISVQPHTVELLNRAIPSWTDAAVPSYCCCAGFRYSVPDSKWFSVSVVLWVPGFKSRFLLVYFFCT